MILSSQSPVLAITLQHRSKVSVTVQESPSSIKNFTAILYQDVSSHFHLNLTLMGGAGTVTGLLTDSQGASQSVSVVVGSREGNTSHTVTVTNNIQCEDNMVREEEVRE